MTIPARVRPSAMVRDRRGSVALELALVMPLLILLLVGFWEVYSYIRSVSMVERSAASIANMMGRQVNQLRDCADSTNSLNLGTYVDVAQRLMAPLPLATQGEVILSAVSNVNNVPTVRWQRRSTFTLKGVSSVLGAENSQATLPRDLAAIIRRDNSVTVMVAEVNYRFTPFSLSGNLWPNNPGEVTISRVAYLRPRTLDLLTPVSAQAAGCTALPKP